MKNLPNIDVKISNSGISRIILNEPNTYNALSLLIHDDACIRCILMMILLDAHNQYAQHT